MTVSMMTKIGNAMGTPTGLDSDVPENKSPLYGLKKLTRIVPEKPLIGDALTVALKSEIASRLLTEISAEVGSPSELRHRSSTIIQSVIADPRFAIPIEEQAQLAKQLADDIVGFGPLEILLSDETISEIMVVSPDEVHVIRGNTLERVHVQFAGNDHILSILDRMTYFEQYPSMDTLPPICDKPLFAWRFPADELEEAWGTLRVIRPPSTDALIVIIGKKRNPFLG